MNPHIPEEYGGARPPGFDGMLVGEELSWGCAGSRSRSSPTRSVLRRSCSGNDDQKAKRLPPLVEEPILCSFGLTSRTPARTSPASGRPQSARATSTSSTARRCSSRTPATPTGWSSSPRRQEQGAQRPVRVRRSDRPRRRRRRKAPGQDGSARDRHVRDRVRRRQGARREPARRGGRGLQDRHEDARFHLLGHRRRRSRRRTGRVRLLGRVCEDAVQFGSHRDEPGDQLVADMATEIEAARLLVWQASWLLDQGARDAAVVVREAVRCRHGDEGDDRRRPDLRAATGT